MSDRANLELEIEKFGPDRVKLAAAQLKAVRGLGAYNDAALEFLLDWLEANRRAEDRIKASNWVERIGRKVGVA